MNELHTVVRALSGTLSSAKYLAAAIATSLAYITIVLLMRSGPLVFIVLAGESSLALKIDLLGSVFFDATAVGGRVSMAFLITAGLLVGATVALLWKLFDRGVNRFVTAPGGIGAVFSAFLGTGCASCGSLLASVFSGGGGLLAGLPSAGIIFSMIGILFLLLGIVMLSRGIAISSACSLD